MKLFVKNNQLDEMQEKKMLKVESRGFWILWVALFVSILIQSALAVPMKQVAAEWIVFMPTTLYMVIELLRNGIWDRHLIPTTGTNIVISILGGICFAVYIAVHMTVVSSEPQPWWLIPTVALVGGALVTALIFVFEQLGLMAYRKRRKRLDDENNTENEEDEK